MEMTSLLVLLGASLTVAGLVVGGTYRASKAILEGIKGLITIELEPIRTVNLELVEQVRKSLGRLDSLNIEVAELRGWQAGFTAANGGPKKTPRDEFP